MVKFIYSEKATKFCDIFTLLLSYVLPVKSKENILQNYVAFSEYTNFNRLYCFGESFKNSYSNLIRGLIQCVLILKIFFNQTFKLQAGQF